MPKHAKVRLGCIGCMENRPEDRPVELMKYVECMEVGVKLRVFSKAIWSISRFFRFYPWTKEASTRRIEDEVRAIFPIIDSACRSVRG